MLLASLLLPARCIVCKRQDVRSRSINFQVCVLGQLVAFILFARKLHVE